MKNKIFDKRYRKLYVTIVIFILIPVFLITTIKPIYRNYIEYKIASRQEEAARITVSRLKEAVYNNLDSDEPDIKGDIRSNIMTYQYGNFFKYGGLLNSNPMVWLLNNTLTPVDIVRGSVKYHTIRIFSSDYFFHSPDYYYFSSDCSHGIAQLFDENGNEIAANKYSFTADIIFADEIPIEYCGQYFCDYNPNIPGLSELFETYETVSNYPNHIVWEGFTLKNAYINFETHSFIPHEGEIRYYNSEEMPENDLIGSAIEKTYPEFIKRIPINITADIPGYELINLERANRTYPYCKILETSGEKQEIIDLARKYAYEDKEPDYRSRNYETDMITGFSEANERIIVSVSNTHMYSKGHNYTLALTCFTDLDAPEIEEFKSTKAKWLLINVISIEALILLIMFIKTRSRVRFENYQRDLTNHLAHDIKTPLMAIGGYTENLLEGDMTEEEQKRYLDSILSNISFTDSVINRTLYLNQTDKIHVRKEMTDLKAIIESAFEKYKLMLEEKQIYFEVTGKATIKTKRDQIEMLIENLISNAVKYTPEQGNISVLVTPKSITVKNSVSEKLRTRKLKQPFVRGDKARSNVKGTGLGLSIADRAATATGFRLKLSCSGSEFKATARKKLVTLK